MPTHMYCQRGGVNHASVCHLDYDEDGILCRMVQGKQEKVFYAVN